MTIRNNEQCLLRYFASWSCGSGAHSSNIFIKHHQGGKNKESDLPGPWTWKQIKLEDMKSYCNIIFNSIFLLYVVWKEHIHNFLFQDVTTYVENFFFNGCNTVVSKKWVRTYLCVAKWFLVDPKATEQSLQWTQVMEKDQYV